MRKFMFTVLVATLASTVAMSGCSRKTDTHDPNITTTTETEVTNTESEVEEITETDDSTAPDYSSRSSSGETTGESSTGSAAGSTDNPNNEGQLICNPEWFNWVNQQVMSDQAVAIAEQYPSGLPDVGSDEWFIAIDKLTGGDGAHGPDGGSDEWCFMMQQRLSKND